MPLFAREGLTLETLLQILSKIALQPLVTGPLLYASTLDILQPPLKAHKKDVVVKVLRVLVAIGVIKSANDTLSRLVMNNWTTDRWRKGEEIVLITGGGSGIGELMARDLAPWSKVIVVLDLIGSKMSLPPNVFYYKVDIRSSAEISTVANQIRIEHGSPSILINNAGVGCPHPVLDVLEEAVRRTFDVNLISHFFIIKEFLPAMIKANHGHVVTIASLASYLSISPTIAYSCSKAGAMAFHEGLANELLVRYNAPRVRTTIVHPSFIRTPLVTRMLENPRFKGFVLEPETVADAVIGNLLESKSGQINIPGRIAIWSCLRAFPSWLQYGLRNREGFGFKKIKGS